LIMLSLMPSLRYSISVSPLTLTKGSTASESMSLPPTPPGSAAWGPSPAP
jgi:hypothetical protein